MYIVTFWIFSKSFCIVYVAGVYRVIKRIVALLSRGAQLEAAAEAAMKQAESATKTAKSYMVREVSK